MTKQTNWQQILIQCKNNIQKQITPLLKTLKQPQPNLGTGAGGDPIKQIDLTAENAIINTLKNHKISFTLISEESGIKEYGKTPYKHYVTADPIDGTTNLTRGIPFYATSIAISAFLYIRYKPTLPPTKIMEKLTAPYKELIAKTTQKPPETKTTIETETLEDLAKIAETLARPILYTTHEKEHTFYIIDNNIKLNQTAEDDNN